MEHSKNNLAIIDIGSNTVRLVIYHKNEFGKFKEKENFKSTARLRHFLDRNCVLKEEGIHLLVKILKGFKEILHFHKVKIVNCVATATIRQAINKTEVLTYVKDQTGLEIKILSEKEEAYYGYFAVIHTTPISEGVTIDIGGGSTEITYFKNRQLVHAHSFPFGVVSLKEQFIKGEKITEEEKNKLQQFILESYHKLPWLHHLNVPIIAIGGSARNVALIDQNFIKYPLGGIHQYTMTPEDLIRLLNMVEQLTISQIEKLEGLSKDRADIILPALEIFVLLCESVQSNIFMLSRKGLRDGIFLKEYEGRKNSTDTDQIIKESIMELVHDYGISPKHSEHVFNLAKQLYSLLEAECAVRIRPEIKRMIDLSSHVYYLGHYVDSDVSSQHTFYLLANKSIDGLDHRKRLKLALIASFKNKMLLKQYCNPFMDWFTTEELQEIRIAGALTKLAAALDATKRGIVKKVILEKNNEAKELTLSFECSGNVFIERYQAEKQIRHLEKAIKKSIHLVFKNDSNS